jgi:hypothetical protein
MAEESERGPMLTTFAVLFAIMAISNLSKPFQFHGVGFVFFGTKLTGVANMIVGPLFGIMLAAYSFGIWNMRRFAVPIGQAYAAYVIANIVMFSIKHQAPGGPGWGAFVYISVAVGVSAGSAIILTRRRAELT